MSSDAPAEAMDLIAAARSGSVRATARLLSWVENGGDRARAVAHTLAGTPRRAHVVGITGAPGAGKSTLTAAMVGHYRNPAEVRPARSVAVLAVDPSSPFSGGALLGDRVRMADHAADRGVFIRSLSSRGHLGGLSAATPAAVDLLSALGYDIVIVETVGVGQSEVDVMDLVDTVVVVFAPGMGDAVQAAKAGIMEIADVMVVNKADHEGTRATMRELRSTLALGRAGDGDQRWRVPVLATTATDGGGVVELVEAADRHRQHLGATGEDEIRRQRRAGAAIDAVVLHELRRLLSGEAGSSRRAEVAAAVVAGGIDHHDGADRMLGWLAGAIRDR